MDKRREREAAGGGRTACSERGRRRGDALKHGDESKERIPFLATLFAPLVGACKSLCLPEGRRRPGPGRGWPARTWSLLEQGTRAPSTSLPTPPTSTTHTQYPTHQRRKTTHTATRTHSSYDAQPGPRGARPGVVRLCLHGAHWWACLCLLLPDRAGPLLVPGRGQGESWDGIEA